MASHHSENSSNDDLDASAGPDPIADIADSFLERQRRGERPTVAEYVEKYPEHAEDIRELFPALELIENLGSDDDSLDEFLAASEDGAEDHSASPDRAPILGDCRLLRVIGRGGMGVVYEAEQISLGRRVALKVLGSVGRTSPRQRERFQREARAAARLHHPHIVPVFGVGEDRDVQYYVMQFVQGSGLDDVIHEVARLRRETHDDGRDSSNPAKSFLASGSELAAGSSSGGSQPSFFRRVAGIGRDVAAALEYAH